MDAEVDVPVGGLEELEDIGPLVEKLQGADAELLLQQLAVELFQSGCEAGGATAATIAEVVERQAPLLPLAG